MVTFLLSHTAAIIRSARGHWLGAVRACVLTILTYILWWKLGPPVVSIGVQSTQNEAAYRNVSAFFLEAVARSTAVFLLDFSSTQIKKNDVTKDTHAVKKKLKWLTWIVLFSSKMPITFHMDHSERGSHAYILIPDSNCLANKSSSSSLSISRWYQDHYYHILKILHFLSYFLSHPRDI